MTYQGAWLSPGGTPWVSIIREAKNGRTLVMLTCVATSINFIYARATLKWAQPCQDKHNVQAGTKLEDVVGFLVHGAINNYSQVDSLEIGFPAARAMPSSSPGLSLADELCA